MDINQTTSVESSAFSNSQKFLLIVVIIIGFIATFISGYFLAGLMNAEKKLPSVKGMPLQVVQPVVSPNVINTDKNIGTVQDETPFLPGKHYFDDTLIVVSKEKPQINIAATVTRSEQATGYLQNSRVSFYDGSSWKRRTNSQGTQDGNIVSNELVTKWKIQIDPSRVLRQKVDGTLNIDGVSVDFSTGLLTNEMSVRSLPGYTKFMSQGSGTVTVNGTVHPVYILYTRIYSLNASDIQFYTEPLGLTTDWIAFWDTKGNFYHVDVTTVDKPTEIYQTHQLGIVENAAGAVMKTFNVDITRDEKKPPMHYVMSFNSPLNYTLAFDRVDTLNKAPNNSYVWSMGTIEGVVDLHTGEKHTGVGLVEYIHD